MSSRRTFIKRVIGVGAGAATAVRAGGATTSAQGGPIAAFDHVAVPMQNTDAMVAFYRALGFDVMEGDRICSVHMANQKINLHRPEFWQSGTFTLRASAATPPCGDFCFVWNGDQPLLEARLQEVGAEVVEGPVPRTGGRDGGTASGTSFYIRDPDQNLLEFIIY